MKSKNLTRQGLLLTLLAISFISASSNKVLAAGTVTICDEAHLRSALAGGGLITFGSDGVITLTSTLDVTNLTTINATGHSVTLSGSNAVRILNINPGVIASLINLTLANGVATNALFGGAGLGGAIFNNGGTAALTSCTIVSNNVVGGAGYLGAGPPPIPWNGGTGGGAGIWNQGGNVLVTNCYFGANGCTGGTGGNDGSPRQGGDSEGGAVGSQGGTLIFQSSVFSNNKSQGGPSGVGFPGQGGNANGGALWASNTTVSCYSSTFANNLSVGASILASPADGGKAGSASGGALFVTNGTVNCIGCIFSANAVYSGQKTNAVVGTAQGGAIWNGSSLVVAQCRFIGNQTVGAGTGGAPGFTTGLYAGEGSGGAIFNNSLLSLSASLLAGNIALGGLGGAVHNYQCYGGFGNGGAIFNLGSLNVTNCTLVANSAIGGDAGGLVGFTPANGGPGLGGALCNSNGVANLVNLTFASNNVAGGAGTFGGLNGSTLGGAIYNTNGTVNLYNIIVSASTPSGSNCFGTLVDGGYNLSSDSSAGFFAAGSMNSTDPILGPLDDYGGPTLTMVLLAGSPAINGGNPATFPPTDQRGRARPSGPASDIGAFESSPPYTVRGFVSGSTLKDEVLVVAGLTTTSTTNHGSYRLDGLSANTWSVTPQSANYLFIPTNSLVTVGPDRLGVNFKAYHWNALSLDDVTNQVMHAIFASTNAPTFRGLVSSNLIQWSPAFTNTIGPDKYSELFIPIGTEAAQFYRAVSP